MFSVEGAHFAVASVFASSSAERRSVILRAKCPEELSRIAVGKVYSGIETPHCDVVSMLSTQSVIGFEQRTRDPSYFKCPRLNPGKYSLKSSLEPGT